MFITRWVGKQMFWHIQTTENNSTVKKSSVDKHNLDEFQKHAKWKRPDTKEHIIYDAMYVNMLNERGLAQKST